MKLSLGRLIQGLHNLKQALTNYEFYISLKYPNSQLLASYGLSNHFENSSICFDPRTSCGNNGSLMT